MIVALCAASLVFACGKRLSTANTRNSVDPAAAAIEVDAELVSDTDGVAIYNWRLGSPNSQVMRASATSAIAGSYAVFPPSAFELDSEVRLEEGATIASQSKLSSLKVNGDIKIVAAAPAVVVSWTYDDETYEPYKLVIPAPAAAGLTAMADQIAVLFIRNEPQADSFVLGMLSGSKLTSEGASVAMNVKGAGIYQAVYLSAAVAEEGEVKSDEPIETTGGSATVPGAFEISGPTIEWSSAKPVVAWGSAKGASYFDVSIDSNDKACEGAEKTYQRVYANELEVAAVKDGEQFVCVKAVNSKGSTAATNDGFAFGADKSAPPKPAKPTHDGPTITTIGVEFRWAAVDDEGPSGMSHYYLEIGTTAGGSDMFKGVVTELEKEIIGHDGQTYYARVKAIDAAGNESEWSANSSSVTVNSN